MNKLNLNYASIEAEFSHQLKQETNFFAYRIKEISQNHEILSILKSLYNADSKIS